MGNSIEYGIRKPGTSEFDRRPNQGEAPGDVYKAGKISDAGKISGHSEGQKKPVGGMSGHGHGANNYGSGKGAVSSFSGSSGSEHQKKGFGGQVKGKNK